MECYNAFFRHIDTSETDMGNVAYYRVSTKQQGESGLGLEAQRAIVYHFIDRDLLSAEFTEVASAKNIDGRPTLAEAVRLCIAEGHTLVVAKIDRLSRKTEDALDIYSKLDGRLMSCDVPNLDKFTLTIFMAIADRERELISIRTKAALEAVKARGVELGKPENMTRAAQEAGAASNREAAQDAYKRVRNYIAMQRGAGQSYRAIAKQLNEDGYTTRTGKKFKGMTIKRIIDRFHGVRSLAP